MRRRAARKGIVVWGCLLALAACSDAAGPEAPNIAVAIAGGADRVRQGDVVRFQAAVTEDGAPSSSPVLWSVEPAAAGLIGGDGRFVAYAPGPAAIVAEAGGARAERAITVDPRNAPAGTFSVVGRGTISDRFTSDLWLHGSFAYSGTWNVRDGPAGSLAGDRLYAWDVANPAAPILTDSVVVDARTVNDVKIREDGSLAVLTHEGAADGLNGITILDLSDPLHPAPIARVTDNMTPGVHNVWIEGDFVYAIVDGSNAAGGLRVVDISDRSSPTVVASFFGGMSGTFGQFAHDVYVRDGLAFVSHWDAGLIILDVGNGIAGGSPQNPIEVSRIETAGGDTHNAWYWPETGYVFVGEEDFSTPGVVHVVDASQLTSPREVATFAVPGTTPHNFWLDEAAGILYAGWYENGLFALDVSGELLGELDRQGRVIASTRYDGVGACRVAGTCTWAPQLHDGHVWVSDQNSGLWSLRLDLP